MRRSDAIGFERALLLVLTTCIAGTAGTLGLLLAKSELRVREIPSAITEGGGTAGLIIGIPVALAYLIYQTVFPSNAPIWKHLLRPALVAMVLATGYTRWWLSVLASI